MKQIERTFLETAKRFFWLVHFRRIWYIKYLIVAFFTAVNLVIHVLFLENIISFLEVQDQAMFNDMLIYYITYILWYEILNFSMRRWWWMEIISMWVSDIYSKYLPDYVKLDNNKVEWVWTGKLVGIIEKWSFEWVESMCNVIEKWMALSIGILFTIYMVGKVNYAYWIIFIVLLVIFFILGDYSNSKLFVFRKIRYELRNDRLRLLVKILMSKIEILQSWKITWEIKQSYKIGSKLTKISQDMGTHRVFLKRASQFGISLLLFVSFYYLGNQYLLGDLKMSVLVWLTGTLIIMQKTIADFMGFYVDFTKRLVSIQKFWDFFDSTPEIKWYETWKKFKYETWEIEIKNMSFAYTKNLPVFEKINLKIPGWKVLAFVWNSWSWKSTLVKIISGYLTHDKWEVIIDGQRNKDISLKSLYKHVGYLTQEPSVFDGSIRDNLMYGTVWNEDESNLKKIIKLAKCEIIYDFPEWLDTEIWEKWIRLSWGQRQRLAIAKIFLKNPEIIILDEPTSALDSFSEEKITIAMGNLFKWRTVIIIAHRLQTVKNADKILVLDNWKIVEEGTHTSLIKQEGVYKKMFDLQSGF